MLTNTFLKLVASFTPDNTLANNLWLEIFTRYSDPKRHYHTITHLESMINELEKVKSEIADWEVTLFAVFYHDIVYDATSNTKEKDSAAIAHTRLTQIGLCQTRIEKCVQMILATKEHKSTPDKDTCFLLDADLSILGAAPPDYQQYAHQIRSEYAIYPDFLYNNGRKKVLRHFLAMKAIFKTAQFQNRLEAAARKNIMWELESAMI